MGYGDRGETLEDADHEEVAVGDAGEGFYKELREEVYGGVLKGLEGGGGDDIGDNIGVSRRRLYILIYFLIYAYSLPHPRDACLPCL